MKLLITGGHFSPALAVIESLSKNDEVLVVGRKYAFEGDKNLSHEYLICEKLSIPFVELKTGRFQRKLSINTFPSLSKLPSGFFSARKILYEYDPDIILCFGGYISLPVALAAFFSKIPIVIHEQTQKIGLANKIISKFANKICISYESSFKYFPKRKTVLTGNPIRSDIYKINKKIDISEKEKIIYITGGSTGSHFINEKIENILENLLSKYTVIHQTGDSKIFNDFQRLSELRESLQKNLKDKYVLRKFIYPDEIGWILKNSDLVISRSGANTVNELISLSKVSLLIPLPIAQNQEQLENAKLLKSYGIGDYLNQNEISNSVLYEKIKYMIENKEKYSVNKNRAMEQIIKNAEKNIINVVKSTYGESKKKKN